MKIEERVHSLLEDNSFPSILLLDGSWGVGKTHFIHNVLKPYIDEVYSESFKSVYLSLYGVTNLDDFKDRILSLVYTKNENASWLATKCSKLTGSSVQVFDGTKGVSAALGSVASIVKSHYFSKLNNVILFLDDLERVSSDTVKSEILGECLYLTENKNIKIVVVANKNEIQLNLKNDLEKVFSDIVHFSRSPSDLISILDDMYTGCNALSLGRKDNIRQILEKHGIDNLRIVRRAIDRFNAINYLYKRDVNLNYDVVDSTNLTTSFIICIAVYKYGFSLSEILESRNNYLARTLVDKKIESDKEEVKRIEIIDNLMSSIGYSATDSLIRFIVNYENTFSNIEQELGLPVSSNNIQDVIEYRFRHHDDEWLKERLPEFKKYIFSPTNETNFPYWMKACHVFSYLIINGYVKEDLNSIKEKIKILLPMFFYLTLEELEDIRTDFRFYVSNNNYEGIFWSFIVNSIESKKQENIKCFKSDFLLSWESVYEISSNEYKLKPMLNLFNKSDFKNILMTWKNREINNFNSYMRDKYNLGNINEYFSDEFESVSIFLQVITKVKNKLPYGAKRGIISELERTLNDVYQRLDERVKESS